MTIDFSSSDPDSVTKAVSGNVGIQPHMATYEVARTNGGKIGKNYDYGTPL